MGLTFEPLGKYVRQVDERNTNMVTESVLGINIDKYFMPSVANVIGTDLSNYKLLRKGRFACNPMHVGRDGRLPVSRYTEDTPAIVSPAYFMFEIIDENEIEPEYLMLCFRRPDFDRMCWFRTDASVRGGITWDDVCALTIPVPSLPEQRKIVHDYQVITNRIELLRKIDANLFQTAKTYLTHIYETDELWSSETTIGGYCNNIASGGTPNRSENLYWENASIPWLKNGEIKNNVIVDTEEYISKSGLENSSARLFPAYSVHMAMYCVSEIQVAMSCIPLTTNQAVLNFGFSTFREASFFYYLLASYGNEITTNANGSAQQNLSKELITAFVFKNPILENTVFSYFEQNLQYRIILARELRSLQDAANVVLSHI